MALDAFAFQNTVATANVQHYVGADCCRPGSFRTGHFFALWHGLMLAQRAVASQRMQSRRGVMLELDPQIGWGRGFGFRSIAAIWP